MDNPKRNDKLNVIDSLNDLNSAYYALCSLLADSVEVNAIDGEGGILIEDKHGIYVIQNLIKEHGDSIVRKITHFWEQ